MVEKRGDILIEVSWEVCNKVGGIHTVLTSKISSMKKAYNKNYFLIGPYIPKNIRGVFEEEIIPEDMSQFCNRCVFDDMKKEGILIHYGRWLVDGEPKVILIDFLNIMPKIDEIKRWLWDNYKIDSLRAGHDYDEVVAWSYCTGRLIEAISKYKKDSRMVAQFHEWLSGSGLLYLKKSGARIPSVFTTHATILGRTLASREMDIYSNIDSIDAIKEAYENNIEAKHMIEMNSARESDVFTTVSEITGLEAEKFLGRKPDMFLPNGLNIESYKTFEETSIQHRTYRDQAREFLLKYFFPYYRFEVKETLFFFTAARYEFRVKGIDVFIESLGRLNKMLQKSKSKKTIVAFIFVPSDIRGVKEDVLNNITLFKDIKDDVDNHIDEIKSNIMFDLLAGRKISKSTIFEEDVLLDLKKKILGISKDGVPQICTHDLKNEDDIIVRSLKDNGLNNTKKDKVKVIFYPIYLTGADGLLDLTYNQAILSSHLGVFPSIYEPWGYTPLETCALGVASLTTNLSGFGRFISDKIEKDKPGVFLLENMGKKKDKIVEDLTKIMFDFSGMLKKDRVKNKIAARKIAELADWELLGDYYIHAHNLALEKAG